MRSLDIHGFDGKCVTQTCGSNALPHLQLPVSQAVSHVFIVVKPATTLRDVFFAPHLHNLLTSSQATEVQLPTLMPEPLSAKTSTTLDALEHPVDTYTSVTTAEATIPAVHAPTKGACIRPFPWTQLRPFMLKWELSNHLDKAFVRQLFDDLQHSCNIGYLGPQFAHSANNLASALRQPEVIDLALQKECEAGRILGPFQSLPLPNFRSSGLGLVPKHDGGCRIIYHLHRTVSVIT